MSLMSSANNKKIKLSHSASVKGNAMTPSSSDLNHTQQVGGDSNSVNSQNTPAKNVGDSLFEPSVDMMVNDFDDERTLEEEEALAATESEDPNAELSNLQRESDMPIEELLALYNCAAPGAPRTSKSSRSNSSANESEEQNIDDEEPSELTKLYPETYKHHHYGDQRLLRTLSRPPSDEEDDGEYSPDEDEIKKTIMVGSEYQAIIPEGLCRYDDALPYENDDKLVWDPSKLNENEIEDYLHKSYSGNNSNASHLKENYISGKQLRDNEQALYLLLQCGHNMEEALRRRRINSLTASKVTEHGMSLWSEEECRNFENGLRAFGKDFHSIQQSKVRTRSVGELVQFYYLWKKTERHDVFANKLRLDKKKYNLHPGVTDYMDRFLEEQENGIGGAAPIGNSINNTGIGINNFCGSGPSTSYRDRSSSPAISCLLYTESLRHHHHDHGGGVGGGGTIGTNHHNHNRRNHNNSNTNNNSIADNASNSLIVTTPSDPLAVGDGEVFSEISTNLCNNLSSNCNSKIFNHSENHQSSKFH